MPPGSEAIHPVPRVRDQSVREGGSGKERYIRASVSQLKGSL